MNSSIDSASGAKSKANYSPWELALILASTLMHQAERPLTDAEWDFYQAHRELVSWWVRVAEEEGWI